MEGEDDLIEPRDACLPHKCQGCPVASPPSDPATGAISELGQHLGDHVQLQSYDDGQNIVRQGDPVKGWWILRAGRTTIYITDAEGREHIIRIAGPGDILGTCGLGPSSNYCYGVRAQGEETQVCFVDRGDFEVLQRKDPQVVRVLTSRLVEDLSDTYARIHNLATRTARARLAHALLDLLSSSRSGRHPAIRMARSELAQLIGVSTETCVRILGQFKGEGLVRTQGRDIEVLDIEGLRDLVEG